MVRGVRESHAQPCRARLGGAGPARPDFRLAALLVKPCSLDGRRGHLREMDEGGLVVRGEASVLVEELYGTELAAVEGGQRCGEPSLKGPIAGCGAEWGQAG